MHSIARQKLSQNLKFRENERPRPLKLFLCKILYEKCERSDSLVVEVERVAGRRWRAFSLPWRGSTEVYRALAVARRALAELPVLAVVHVIEVEVIPDLGDLYTKSGQSLQSSISAVSKPKIYKYLVNSKYSLE